MEDQENELNVIASLNLGWGDDKVFVVGVTEYESNKGVRTARVELFRENVVELRDRLTLWLEKGPEGVAEWIRKYL